MVGKIVKKKQKNHQNDNLTKFSSMWFGVQIEKCLIFVGNLIGYTELQIYRHNVFFQL